MAVAGLDLNHDGRANVLVVGADRNRDGMPDVLERRAVVGGGGYGNNVPVGRGAGVGLAAGGTPMAVAGLDLNHDGRANVLVAGADRNRDGIPDVLQRQAVVGGGGYGNNVPVGRGAGVGLATGGTPMADGRANVLVGADRNRDGIPDVLERQ